MNEQRGFLLRGEVEENAGNLWDCRTVLHPPTPQASFRHKLCFTYIHTQGEGAYGETGNSGLGRLVHKWKEET